MNDSPYDDEMFVDRADDQDDTPEDDTVTHVELDVDDEANERTRGPLHRVFAWFHRVLCATGDDR